MIIYKENFLNAVENNSRNILRKCSRGMFQNVLCECSLNVPTKSSTNVRYKCSLNVPMEGSRNGLFEYSLNIAAECSLNIPFERSTGTFREHCFGKLKKPGHFLSSRNFLERSDGTFRTFHGNVHRMFKEGIVLWGKINDKETNNLCQQKFKSLHKNCKSDKLPCGFYRKTLWPFLPAPAESPKFIFRLFTWGFVVSTNRLWWDAGTVVVEGIQMLRIIMDRNTRTSWSRHFF